MVGIIGSTIFDLMIKGLVTPFIQNTINMINYNRTNQMHLTVISDIHSSYFFCVDISFSFRNFRTLSCSNTSLLLLTFSNLYLSISVSSTTTSNASFYSFENLLSKDCFTIGLFTCTSSFLSSCSISICQAVFSRTILNSLFYVWIFSWSFLWF